MNGARIDCIADTSAVIGLARRDRKTTAIIGTKSFAITFVTLAELLLGVLKIEANKRPAAWARIREVLGEGQVFYASEKTPLIYASICHDLEQRGLRIPGNDMWIAAVALEGAVPLVARDEHFTRVKDLVFIPC